MKKIPISPFPVLFLLILSWFPSPKVSAESGFAEALLDFHQRFGDAIAEHAEQTLAQNRISSGSSEQRAIFLHPPSDATASLRFPSVSFPEIGENEKLLLVFGIGIRDEANMDPNEVDGIYSDGVRFAVEVGEGPQTVGFSGEKREHGWTWKALDLTEFSGTEAPVVFSTHPIENCLFDWAYFADPLLIRLSGIEKPWTSGRILEASPAGDSLFLEGKAFRHQPILRIVELDKDRAVIERDRPFSVLVRIQNKGRGVFEGSDGSELTVLMRSETFGNTVRMRTNPIPPLAPEEETVLLFSGNVVTDQGPVGLQARLQGIPGKEQVFTTAAQAVSFHGNPGPVVESGRGTIELWPPDEVRAGLARIRVSESEPWERVAILYPLAEITVRDRESGKIIRPDLSLPWNPQESPVEEGFRLTREIREKGLTGRLEIRLVPEISDGLIRCDLSLQFNEDVELLRFAGPRLAFGDGTFGSRHGIVVFPGLEYFGSEDHSSSLLDAEFPLNLRGIPHPHKVAIPIMSIEQDAFSASILWEPRYEWTPGERNLSSSLKVPSEGDGRNYSSMQLFVPSIPQYVREHENEAYNPYPLAAGQSVRIRQWVYLEHKRSQERPSITGHDLEGEFGLVGVQKYLDRFGLAKPMPMPRTWEEQKALSRIAWMKTIWDEEQKGWRHVNDRYWPVAPAPGHALLLLLDAVTEKDVEIRESLMARIEEAMGPAIEKNGPGFLASGVQCHILRGEYAFFRGHLFEAIDRWSREAEGLMRGQQPEGGWGFHPNPNNLETSRLGESGQQESGTIANHSFQILKIGRITGDTRFIEAGLKGIDRMEQFRIPRGAQGWEVPLHAADILASAHAVRANVEAYQITSDLRYLLQARYWAWSGMPFIYQWEVPEIPSMRYNTTPVFGSTFFSHNWIGVPVVWCGLVYAYALQELTRFDSSYEWRTVAEGITHSAMHQQYEEDHPSAGCYPDNYNLLLNKKFPWDINPENIMLNGFALRGLDPAILTRTYSYRGESVRVSGPFLALRAGQGIRFSVKTVPHLPLFYYLSSMPKPDRISVHGETIQETDILEGVLNGFRYDSSKRRMEIKVTTDIQGEASVEID